MQLHFTPLAESDLIRVLDHVAKHRPQTALAVVNLIQEKCGLLALHPELGQLRPELSHGVRSFSVKRWVIYYRIEDHRLTIVRVLDGAQDAHSQLGADAISPDPE